MKAVSSTILFTAVALFLGLSHAETFVDTQTFGSHNFHQVPEFNAASKTGLILGWIVFGVIMFVAGVLIIADTVSRHKEYVGKLEEARNKMQQLGISVTEADREFEKKMRGDKEEDEDQKLIEAAEKQDEAKA